MLNNVRAQGVLQKVICLNTLPLFFPCSLYINYFSLIASFQLIKDRITAKMKLKPIPESGVTGSEGDQVFQYFGLSHGIEYRCRDVMLQLYKVLVRLCSVLVTLLYEEHC